MITPRNRLHFSFFVLTLFFFISQGGMAQTFILPAGQSMCMIGKGIGQDATLRPKTDSVAVARIKNKGKHSFTVRVEKNGQIIKQIALGKHQKLLWAHRLGDQIFLDSPKKRKAKAEFIWVPQMKDSL